MRKFKRMRTGNDDGISDGKSRSLSKSTVQVQCRYSAGLVQVSVQVLLSKYMFLLDTVQVVQVYEAKPYTCERTHTLVFSEPSSKNTQTCTLLMISNT